MDDLGVERWHEFYPRWLAYAKEHGSRLGLDVEERDEGGILVRGDSDRQAELYQLLMDMLIGWGQSTKTTSA